MTLAILGLGTTLPETIITQEEAFSLARTLCCHTEEQATWVPAMYQGTEIATRGHVLGREVVDDVLHGTRHSGSVFLPREGIANGEDQGPTTAERMQHYANLAPPLAVRAGQLALGRSGLAADDLTHLITVSCTGFVAPGIDCALIENLGLPMSVQRTHIGFMGCHGAINGLRVAEAFAATGGRVLLCAVELCSLHYHYGWDPQKVIANALFADGAAALVGMACPEGRPPWTLAATGSCLFPGSTRAMSWTVGDHGFEMGLSRQVPSLIARQLRPWLEGWLRQQDLTPEDIRSWAVHPGGPRILSAVEEGLGLPSCALEVSRQILAECGNMSSPTVLFILERFRQQGDVLPCLALGFGPGLVAEVALFR
jgi:predicted naringenin-chalcone synthase